MKNKSTPFFLSLLAIVSITYGQDSTRTRNDKPGTPSSLRVPDNSPQNNMRTINNTTTPNQSIYHGGLESGNDNTTNQKSSINNTNGIVQPPMNTNLPLLADTINSNETQFKKPANITDPTRK